MLDKKMRVVLNQLLIRECVYCNKTKGDESVEDGERRTDHALTQLKAIFNEAVGEDRKNGREGRMYLDWEQNRAYIKGYNLRGKEIRAKFN